MRLLAGFTRRRVEVGEVALQAAVAGDGPPVVLLHASRRPMSPGTRSRHGWPNGSPWSAPDLRGYGGSGKPPGDPGHQRYAKRTMAADVRALMAALGHDRFAVVGHDRGALVGYHLFFLASRPASPSGSSAPTPSCS
jgi:haloacetate dehalogenase